MKYITLYLEEDVVAAIRSTKSPSHTIDELVRKNFNLGSADATPLSPRTTRELVTLRTNLATPMKWLQVKTRWSRGSVFEAAIRRFFGMDDQFSKKRIRLDPTEHRGAWRVSLPDELWAKLDDYRATNKKNYHATIEDALLAYYRDLNALAAVEADLL